MRVGHYSRCLLVENEFGRLFGPVWHRFAAVLRCSHRTDFQKAWLTVFASCASLAVRIAGVQWSFQKPPWDGPERRHGRRKVRADPKQKYRSAGSVSRDLRRLFWSSRLGSRAGTRAHRRLYPRAQAPQARCKIANRSKVEPAILFIRRSEPVRNELSVPVLKHC